MNHPTLRAGDTSPELQDAVKELQTDLKSLGFDIAVDGAFGPATEAAVRQFQDEHNLGADGIVGRQTWDALDAAANRGANTAGGTDTGDGFTTTISNSDARMGGEFAEALKFKTLIDAGAQRIGVLSVVIAGIGSRESGWGVLLRPPGPTGTGDFGTRHFPTEFRTGPLPPDGGFGRGLMQIDFDANPFARTGNWQDPEANINCGCDVLGSNLDLLSRKTSLQGRELLQAAVAAYNCGTGNVLKALDEGIDVDSFTTGKDYSADVFNRAGFFQNMGWDSSTQVAGAGG